METGPEEINKTEKRDMTSPVVLYSPSAILKGKKRAEEGNCKKVVVQPTDVQA